MRINSSVVTALENELGKKLNLQPAGNNLFVLPVGDYVTEIILEDGTKKSKKFSLKEPVRPSFQGMEDEEEKF